MRGSYVFKYDLWASFFDFGKRTKVMSKRVVNGLDRTKSMGPVWKTFYLFRDRSVLANFGRPIVPPSLSGFLGRGRGAMEGTLQVIGFPLYVVAVQTGVSQKDVVPFQITVPEYPDASVQGEYNCKTEEVYFGFVVQGGSARGDSSARGNPVSFTAGFSTRKPAKKMSGPP